MGRVRPVSIALALLFSPVLKQFLQRKTRMAKRRTESDIMALKAQEAKEYCIELLHELDARSRDPLSPGEVQLHELQYELKLKEAEAQDEQDRQAHELRLKELELDIEKERTRHAESTKLADEAKQHHAQIIQQVSESQEQLSIQLERATTRAQRQTANDGGGSSGKVTAHVAAD